MRDIERTQFSRERSSTVSLVAETCFTLRCCANAQQGLWEKACEILHPLLLFFFFCQIAIEYPGAVTACNVDLETLITDSNRSIATLAITTLLKVSSPLRVVRTLF